MDRPDSPEMWDASSAAPHVPSATVPCLSPYLRQVHAPGDPRALADMLAVSQLPHAYQLARALIARLCNPRAPGLFQLRKLPMLEQVEVNDRLLMENAVGLGVPEYPGLYVLVNEYESFVVDQMEKYLAAQETVSFGFYGINTERFRPVIAVVCSAHLAVVFDLTRLELGRTLLFFRGLLENPAVVKVVNWWPPQLLGLDSFYTIRPVNLHDVSFVEAHLAGQPLRGMFTIRNFYARYRRECELFQRFGEECFQTSMVTEAPGMPGLVHWKEEELFPIVKQVLFLQLIRTLQTQRCMQPAIRETELALRELYASSEWEVAKPAADAWNDANPVFVSQDTAPLPAVFLTGQEEEEEDEEEQWSEAEHSESDEPEGSAYSQEEEFYY